MQDLSYVSKNSNLNINDLKYMQIENVNPEIINQNELKVIKYFGEKGA